MHLVYGGVAAVVLLLLAGTRVVRPTGRGVVERLGKYRRMAMPGFN
jgi:regulator of protease activity HflC (stomatin/prohibitin superfamily)